MIIMNWSIITSEISFRTSRSSGPGGQHVNKTETKVEVLFDVQTSDGLNEDEKAFVMEKLGNRINKEGLLTIRSQKAKSQLANKEIVVDKLQVLLTQSIVPVKKRVKTKPSKASKEARLTNKKMISQKKEVRRKPEA
jgi:ribosome-associated protein